MQILTTQHASVNKKILSSIAALICIQASSLFALDMPIAEQIPIVLTSNGKSIIEFPFAAKLQPYEFIPAQGYRGEIVPPTITKGENVYEFASKTPGSIEFTVLGGERPFFIKAVFEPSGEKYYRLLPAKDTDENLKEFESSEHEIIITNLAVAAYNNKPPKGYTVTARSLKKTIEGIPTQMVNEFVGSEYAVQTWIITNPFAETLHPYEEMFAYEFGKIYGISLEATTLQPGESTKLFIIKSAS